MSDNQKFKMLMELTAINFTLIDLHLYLNTHPNDETALMKYNAYSMELAKQKMKYEKCYGMISLHGSLSPYPWQWINEPWPWEYEANFKLAGMEE